MKSKIDLIDSKYKFEEELDDLFMVSKQEITDEFMDDIKAHRLASKNNRNDWQKVASIPTVIIDKWMREGFDVFSESPRAIMRRLRANNLDYFIATGKSL
jgi:hypothetical protein